jgi:5'-nucleotidase
MPTPLILITNDDGIKSPGLRAVAQAIADLGELLIVAPREQQTSMGRAFHGTGVARSVVYAVNRRRMQAFAVPTSPAVVVRHAILLIADRVPALAISGINYGVNMGSGITISGTVGAALESAGLGIPAIAVSLDTEQRYHRSHSTAVDFTIAAQFARQFAECVLRFGMPRGVDVLNINVPSGASIKTPWRWTRVSRRTFFESVVVQTRAGRRFAGYEQVAKAEDVEPDSDIYALLHDHAVSVSPLTIDLTARVRKSVLEKWGRET